MSFKRHQSLGFWCTRISLAMRAKLDARIKRPELTRPAAIALVTLDQHGPTTLVDLAHALEHAHPSVLRQIDLLEETGFAERIPHEHDRRMKIVRLTAKGRKALPAIYRSMRSMQAESLAGFREIEIEKLMGQFQRIASNLGMQEFPLDPQSTGTHPKRTISRVKKTARRK